MPLTDTASAANFWPVAVKTPPRTLRRCLHALGFGSGFENKFCLVPGSTFKRISVAMSSTLWRQILPTKQQVNALRVTLLSCKSIATQLQRAV